MPSSRLVWRLKLWLRRRRRPRFEDEDWDPLEFPPSVLTTVKVADLPPPHHLFKCPHENRLGQLPHDFNLEDHQHAWDAFVSSLTTDDLRRCDYHRADWRKVAALSVAVLARVQHRQRLHKAQRVIRRRFKLAPDDRDALFWLFADPILWSFDSLELTNGQHRVCALKVAGADVCVVDR